MARDALGIFEQKFGSSQPRLPELSDGAKKEIAQWWLSNTTGTKDDFLRDMKKRHPGWNQDATLRAWDEITRQGGFRKYVKGDTAGEMRSEARASEVGRKRTVDQAAGVMLDIAGAVEKGQIEGRAGAAQSLVKAGTLGVARPDWGGSKVSETITDIGTLPLQMVGGAGLAKGAAKGLTMIPGVARVAKPAMTVIPKVDQALSALGSRGPAAGLLATGGKAVFGAAKGLGENAIWTLPGGLVHGDWVEQNTNPVNLALGAGLGAAADTVAPPLLRFLSRKLDTTAAPAAAPVERGVLEVTTPAAAQGIDLNDPQVHVAWEAMNQVRQYQGLAPLDIGNRAHHQVARRYLEGFTGTTGIPVNRPELPGSVGSTYDGARTIPEGVPVGQLPPPRQAAIPPAGTPLSHAQIRGAFTDVVQTHPGVVLSDDGTVAFFAPPGEALQVGGIYQMGDGQLGRVVGVSKTGKQIAYELPTGEVRKTSPEKWDGTPYSIHVDDWARERGYLGGNSSEMPNSSSNISDISNMGAGLDDAGGALPVPARPAPRPPVLEAGDVVPVQRNTDSYVVPVGGKTDAIVSRHGGIPVVDVRSIDPADPPTGAVWIRTQDARLAPEVFQYKQMAGPRGVVKTSPVTGSRYYNPDLAGAQTAWMDPASGELYIINGHNRHARAQDAGFPAVKVEFSRAADAGQARVQAAIENIVEDHGTPIDAGKLFRESNYTPEDLERYGVSLTGRVSSGGRALADLDADVWSRVVSYEVPEGIGVAIGANLKDPVEQLALMRLIDDYRVRRGNWPSAAYVERAAEKVRLAPKVQTEAGGLFGGIEEHSTVFEQLDVEDYIDKALGADKFLHKQLAGQTSKGQAKVEKLSQSGNKINTKANAQIAQAAEQTQEIFRRLKNAAGEDVALAIREAGERIARGEDPNVVYPETYGRVVDSISTNFGVGKRANSRGNQAGNQKRTVSRSTGPDNGSAAAGSDPGVNPSPDSDPGFTYGRSGDQTTIEPTGTGRPTQAWEVPPEELRLVPEGGNSQNMSMFSPSETSGGGKARARLSQSERAQELKNRIIKKTTPGKMGVEPSVFLDAAELGYYYLADGVNDFAAWSRRMVQDLGMAVEPYMHQVWRALTEGGDPAAALRKIQMDPESYMRPRAAAATAGARVTGDVPAARRVEPGEIPTSPDGGGRVPPEMSETSPSGPGGEELPKYAGNINLNRLETPDQVKAEILDAAESITLDPKWANRTRRISWEETEAAAQQMGMTLDDVKKIRPGRPLSEAEVLALRDLHLEYAERVHAAKVNVREAGTPEAKAELIQRMLEYQSIHQALRGVTANAGRTLNIYRKMAAAARAAASGTYRDDAYKKLMEMVGGSEYADDAIRLMMEIPEDDYTALTKFLRDWRKFKTGQKLEAYTYANILSGMSTHMTNTISNIGWGATQLLTKPVAGLFDAARGALQKGYTREHYIRAVPAAIAGHVYGLPTGLRRALYLMKHGFDIGEARTLDIGNDFEFRGGVKNPWNWPGRALRAADAITSEMARSSQIAYDAMVTAIREGKRGDELNARVQELILEPTHDMIERADKFARYSTFTDQPGEFSRKLVGALNTPIPDGLPLAGLRPGRFVVKFVQVPMNIFKAGLEFTPGVGLAKLAHADVRGSGQASEVLAKQAIGGAVLAYGAYLASEGLITAAAPENEAARDAFYRNGKQPYSVKVGETWLPYAKLGPLSMPLAAAAGYWSKYDESGELPDTDRISRTASTIGRSVLDQSYLAALSDLVEAISDPEKRAQRLLANLGSQFVPMSGMLRNVEYATDNKVRDAKRYEDRGFMEQVGDQISTGIPGLAQRVPARVDTLGRDIERQGRTGLYGFMPAGPSKASQDPVDQELSRLHVFPAFPQKYLQSGDTRLDLTREQYHELQRRIGGDTYQALYDVVTSDWYGQLDDETRAEVLEQYIGDARSSARELYKYEMGMFGGQ